MSHYIRSGNTYRVHKDEALDIKQELPVGNYTIGEDAQGNLFLEHIDPFVLPVKIYGKFEAQAKRILNTYKDRSNNTGVLLAGEKGSGKTMLAKLLAVTAAKEGCPTIIINRPWTGDRFSQLIQNISQPTILFFDEFEKVYNKEDDQNDILTLLDGVFQTKKLMIFTSNDKWRINQHMRNRPGRLFYLLDFQGLDVSFIREYCQVELHDKSYIETVCQVSNLFQEFNFDLLKALVEEMNRYNESPSQALEMLNAKPGYEQNGSFEIQLTVDGKLIATDDLSDPTYNGLPLGKTITIGYMDAAVAEKYKNEDDATDEGYRSITFVDKDLVKMEAGNSTFIFSNAKGAAIFTRRKQSDVNYAKYL